MLGCQNDKLEENYIHLQLPRCLDEPVEVKIDLSPDKEIQENPLSEFRPPSVKKKIFLRYY